MAGPTDPFSRAKPATLAASAHQNLATDPFSRAKPATLAASAHQNGGATTSAAPAVEAPAVETAAHRASNAWACSGLMALSGPPPGGRTGPPAHLVGGVARLGARIELASRRLGRPVELDWLALLGERAALAGLRAQGRRSCGGATEVLPCADGWVAVTLARPDDIAAVPAWLAIAAADATVAGPGSTSSPDWPAVGDLAALRATPAWPAVVETVRRAPAAALVEAAELLGVPVARLGERRADLDGGVTVTAFPSAGPPTPPPSPPPWRVVDLTSLWAGPLCGSVLAGAGAHVTKVEAADRPDGARRGEPRFFELLNGAKAHVSIGLTDEGGRAELGELVRSADVVLESSRPRALEALGLAADELIAEPDGPRLWVSITGHGRASPRVGFGDDAAVAGGLVVWHDDEPWCCGDAIADPLAGLAAAATTLELMADGRRARVDVAMAGVAAAHAGPTLAPPGAPPAPPRARPAPAAMHRR